MNFFTARLSLFTTALLGLFLFCGVIVRAAALAVPAGRLVTLSATADGTAPFTFQWYKDGSAISGATSSSYTISSFQAANAGTYTTVVSNSAGSSTSDSAVLTLEVQTVSPAFTTQPISQTVTAGAAVTFTAAASGTPAPTFQWMKGGVAISGATSSSYTLSSTVTGDAGSYAVTATNSAGAVTSNAASLTVNLPATVPVFTTQPISQTVTAGAAVTFTAAASGSPAPTFQWKKGGVAISGATSSSYTIASTVTGSAGSYTVTATNSAGAVTSNAASLTVNLPATAPIITAQPASQTVTSGASVTFSVTASGTPAPTYQWKKNGVTLSGATSSTYSSANVTTTNSGTYTVVVTNSAGSVTSNGAVLTVNSAPAFTVQPASQTATAGGSVTFSAAASGSPTPTYQWKKSGTVISGATSASYTISTVTSGNAGSYTLVATNSVGTATSTAASLTVNPAPSAPQFTLQPVTQAVIAGDPVTLTAAASGTPAPIYQWMKDGLAIPGATSASYLIPTVAITDAASYTVVASNSMGAVTSSVAVLSVNAAPKNAIVTLTIIE